MRIVGAGALESEMFAPGWFREPSAVALPPLRPRGTGDLKSIPKSATQERKAVAADSYRRAVAKYGRPRKIGVGEIKSDRPSARAKGVDQLNTGNRLNYAGNRALVTYDGKGNVFMTQWKPNGDVAWNGVVGTVTTPRGVQYGHPDFGKRIEARVARLVSRTLKQPLAPHRSNAGGPDLAHLESELFA